MMTTSEPPSEQSSPKEFSQEEKNQDSASSIPAAPRVKVVSKGKVVSRQTSADTAVTRGTDVPRKAPLKTRLPNPSELRGAAASAPSTKDLHHQDEQLRKQVIEQLADLGDQMRMTVQVSVRQGKVILKGTVDSEYNRLLISSTVARLSGPSNVQDELKIRSRFNQPLVTSHIDSEPFLASKSGKAIVAGIVLAVLAAGWFLTTKTELLAATLYNVPITVVYKGKPAVGAQLTLISKDQIGTNASQQQTVRIVGEVKSDGTVAWKTGGRQGGIPAGDYAVTVMWRTTVAMSPGQYVFKNVLPEEFLNAQETPFSLVVKKGELPSDQLELKR